MSNTNNSNILVKKHTSACVRIRDNRGSEPRRGEIRVQFWDKRDRTLRALKFGAICWGAAIVSVLIPLLHFFLVPSFLFAGPLVAFVVWGQESTILGGEGICPNCKAQFRIVRTRYKFPISEVCDHCKNGLKIELENAQSV